MTLTGLALTLGVHDSCCAIRRISVTSENNPLSHVQLALTHDGHRIAVAYTDSTGTATFHHLCSGDFQIGASLNGYESQHQMITVGDCDSADVSMSLTSNGHPADTCCGGTMSFAITDSTGALLTDATIHLNLGGTTHSFTADHGTLVVHHLCEGSYTISIDRPHYETVHLSRTLTCNDSLPISVQLQAVHQADSCCTGSSTITVLDSASQHAVSNATLVLTQNGHSLHTLTADAHGILHLSHLCEGTYGLSISADGYHTTTHEITIQCNGADTTTVLLSNAHHATDTCCSSVLTFAVTDSHSGLSLDSVTVTLSQSHHTIATSTTDANGQISFSNVCSPMNYDITFSRHGYHGSTMTLSTDDCRTYDHNVALQHE